MPAALLCLESSAPYPTNFSKIYCIHNVPARRGELVTPHTDDRIFTRFLAFYQCHTFLCSPNIGPREQSPPTLSARNLATTLFTTLSN